MNYTLEDLFHMNDEDLDNAIAEDAAGEGELMFELEGELMAIMAELAFPDSETFGDEDKETPSERAVRLLVESLDVRSTLGAISALNDELEEESDGEATDPE